MYPEPEPAGRQNGWISGSVDGWAGLNAKLNHDAPGLDREGWKFETARRMDVCSDGAGGLSCNVTCGQGKSASANTMHTRDIDGVCVGLAQKFGVALGISTSKKTSSVAEQRGGEKVHDRSGQVRSYTQIGDIPSAYVNRTIPLLSFFPLRPLHTSRRRPTASSHVRNDDDNDNHDDHDDAELHPDDGETRLHFCVCVHVFWSYL
jgi:hypothetical protein